MDQELNPGGHRSYVLSLFGQTIALLVISVLSKICFIRGRIFSGPRIEPCGTPHKLGIKPPTIQCRQLLLQTAPHSLLPSLTRRLDSLARTETLVRDFTTTLTRRVNRPSCRLFHTVTNRAGSLNPRPRITAGASSSENRSRCGETQRNQLMMINEASISDRRWCEQNTTLSKSFLLGWKCYQLGPECYLLRFKRSCWDQNVNLRG